MVVDVGEAWTPPHPFALTGPQDWRPPLSRAIFHESVHYWQFIGHAHLIELMAEDWARLRQFDATGDNVPPGPLRRAFAQRMEGAGFSTLDLMEAHARFWDVQALGPPLLIELELQAPQRDISQVLTRTEYEQLKADGKIWHHYDAHGEGVGYSSLSFDLAMRLAAGRYAVPYLRLREQTNELIAAALFPLCVHFALHSASPPGFYLALVERLVPQIDLAAGRPIEHAWRSLYMDVLREAMLLHLDRHGCEFRTRQATIHDSPLFHELVGYAMAHTLLAQACDHLGANRPPDFLVGPESMPPGMRSLWTMDFLLGCCGMAASRTPDLLAFLAPPVIRFADGQTWIPGAIFDAFPFESAAPATAKQPPPRSEVAAALLALDETWNAMQLKVLGA
jgi:hypothetical protein